MEKELLYFHNRIRLSQKFLFFSMEIYLKTLQGPFMFKHLKQEFFFFKMDINEVIIPCVFLCE